MTTPQISVVIPTHNRRVLLEEMLMALSTQTYPSEQFEVIVVIDGGQDDTPEMLQNLKTPYLLRHVYQAQSGVAVARNQGSYLARGPVLVFLDDDLLPLPELLAEHTEVHRQDDQAVVLGRLLPADKPQSNGGGKKAGWNIWEERVMAKQYRAIADGSRPPAGRRLYSGNFSVGAKHFLSAGGFEEKLSRGEDIELGYRLERRGLHFYFSPQAKAIHRGYRTFDSWCNSAYLYGRTDVRLFTEKGFPVLPELFNWYYGQPSLARRVVELCCDRATLHQTAIWGLRAGSGALTRLGVHSLAHVGYSGIYKLQYWQGVADEMGGKEKFNESASEWRQSSLQPGPPTGGRP